MPLFMLISGYLFWFSEQKRGLVELIGYKGKSFLYPILMCSVLNLLLTTGIVSTLRGEYSALLGGIPITSLWFLWSVLACSVALAFAMKLSKNHLIQTALLIIGVPFVALFPNWTMNVYMYPYLIIGYLYARYEGRMRKVRNVGGFISTIVFIFMMFFFEKKHYIYISGLLGGETIMESLQIDFFRWSIGLLGSIAVAWICWLLSSVHKRGKITIIIENIGQDSLAVYALSTSLLSYWLPIIAGKILSVLAWINWNNYIWIYNLFITPIVAAGYSMLLLLIIKGLKRTNAYGLIFGR